LRARFDIALQGIRLCSVGSRRSRRANEHSTTRERADDRRSRRRAARRKPCSLVCRTSLPACSVVMITSAADLPYFSILPTGIPRPSSVTEMELSDELSRRSPYSSRPVYGVVHDLQTRNLGRWWIQYVGDSRPPPDSLGDLYLARNRSGISETGLAGPKNRTSMSGLRR